MIVAGYTTHTRLFSVANATKWLGIALLALLVGVYSVTGFGFIRRMDQAAAGVGQVIVGGRGDPALRDLPQAHALAIGQWYDDAHYTGEVHWYPFATPLLVAWYMRLFGEPLQSAYRIVAMLLNAAILPALAVLLARFCGWRALLVLPICAILGIYWPNDSNYPAGTSIAPFVLSMALIGFAFERIATVRLGLLFGVGAATGFLALWHGASFYSACFAGGALLVAFAFVRWRAGIGWILGGWLVTGLGVFTGASPLLVPQLLRYGTVRQADTARLYLNPELYGDGNNPAALFRLALVPTGITALLVLLFVVLVAASRDRPLQLRSIPLVVSYLIALALGHLGFILNNADHPLLVRFAKTVLVAPPHTFAWIAGTLQTMMSILAIGLVLELALCWWNHMPRRLIRPWLSSTIAAVALVGTYGWLVVRMPGHDTGHIEQVDRGMFTFAQTVSQLAGQQSVYVPSWQGQRDILMLMPFKVVHMHAPLHSNQYVDQERALVEQRLSQAATNASDFDTMVQRYNIGFVLTVPGVRNVFAYLCGGTLVAQSPQNHQLWQLHPPCRKPVFGPSADLAPNDRLGLDADQEQPLRVVGIKNGATTNFVAFPPIEVRPNTLTELRFRGTLEGLAAANCLSPRAAYWSGEVPNGAFDFAPFFSAEQHFDLRYWLITPDGTTRLAPRLAFDPACFANGQKIRVEAADVAQERSRPPTSGLNTLPKKGRKPEDWRTLFVKEFLGTTHLANRLSNS